MAEQMDVRPQQATSSALTSYVLRAEFTLNVIKNANEIDEGEMPPFHGKQEHIYH